MFFESDLKRVFFVMALVSIRTRTKCLSFENISNESVGVKMFCGEQASNYERIYLLKRS